jgi:hypothetical protein
MIFANKAALKVVVVVEAPVAARQTPVAAVTTPAALVEAAAVCT